MTKERILFVGQHPDLFTGNGNMLYECLQQVDREKYDFCAYVQGEIPPELILDPFSKKNNAPCTYISSTTVNDGWGKQRLLNLIAFQEFDQLVFIGIDIWRYSELFEHIIKLKTKKGFVWKVLVPYDLTHLRKDWIRWLNTPDHVFVYSEYAYDLLKEHIANLSYFRPTIRDQHLYTPLTEEERKKHRKQVFPDISDDTTIFGFIGMNQIRKNILKMLEGFSQAIHKRKEMTGKDDIILYLHMDTPKGVFNVEQIAHDCDIPDAVIRHNGGSRRLQPHEMALMYKIFDAHLLFSLQEGLSWTVLESKLAGVPSLLSRSTSHLDYIKTGTKENGLLACFPDTEDMLPLMTETGPAYVRAQSCSSSAIADCILKYMKLRDKGKTETLRKNAFQFGKEWCSKSDNISKILEQEVMQNSKMGEEI